MAVTTQQSDQYKLQFSSTGSELGPVYPTEVRGKVVRDFFSFTQSGAGDATSSFAAIKLPPGRVRVYLISSALYCNWTTASATLDIGHDAYTQIDGTAITADVDSLMNGISVESAGVIGFEELTASAGASVTAANGYTALFDSRDGVVIRVSSTDTAIADTDSAAGYIEYVCA